MCFIIYVQLKCTYLQRIQYTCLTHYNISSFLFHPHIYLNRLYAMRTIQREEKKNDTF